MNSQPRQDLLDMTEVISPIWKFHKEVEDLVMTLLRVVCGAVLSAGLQPPGVDWDGEGIGSRDGCAVCREDVIDNELHDSCKAYEDDGS